MKGDYALSSELVVAVIIAIITVFLIYVVFPRSACDAEAKLSAIEIKKAIECAAGTGPQNCSSEAVVKLCQESAWSMTGVGYVQAYYGLMVPEFLIYYQQFPTKDVAASSRGAGWSDTYPFERSGIGQRAWDTRPTLTQFKQFFKTKYLQEPCTSDTALCVNIRGMEDILKINLPENVNDVRLERGGTPISEANPKFHLAAPCYAKFNFSKDGSSIIGARSQIGTTSGSNYCFADTGTITGEVLAFGGEIGCKAVDVALTVFSFGTKKVVQVAAQNAAKAIGKIPLNKAELRVIEKESLKFAEEQTSKLGGKLGSTEFRRYAAIKAAELAGANSVLAKEIGENVVKQGTKPFWGKIMAQTVKKKGPGYAGFDLTSVFGVPCIDIGDPCRGLFSCAETLFWPGWPFEELTPEKMTGSFSHKETYNEILGNCCEEILYSPESDFKKIPCFEPSEIVELVKQEIGTPAGIPLSAKNITERLKITEDQARTKCSTTFYTDRYQNCMRTEEVKSRAGTDCVGLDSHTYSVGTTENTITGKVILAFIQLDDGDVAPSESCKTTVSVSYHNGNEWKPLQSVQANAYPESNAIIARLPAEDTISKVKIEDTGLVKCHLASSSISIDPTTELPTEAQPNVAYELDANKYSFFILPTGYHSTAKELCDSLRFCASIQKFVVGNFPMPKYLKGDPADRGFEIAAGDEIGILVRENDRIIFRA